MIIKEKIKDITSKGENKELARSFKDRRYFNSKSKFAGWYHS